MPFGRLEVFYGRHLMTADVVPEYIHCGENGWKIRKIAFETGSSANVLSIYYGEDTINVGWYEYSLPKRNPYFYGVR